MPAKKHRIVLDKSQEAYLSKLTQKGKHLAREISRARILIMTNENGQSKTDSEISTLLNVSISKVESVRRKYSIEGIERSIYDKPRSGRPKVLTGKQEATIIATACSDPPDGHHHWTLDLLTEKTQGDKNKGSRNTVYRVCLANELKPWREKNVVYSHTK